MDFTGILVLSALVFTVVELVKRAAPVIQGYWLIIAAVVVGQASTFTVAASDFGSTEVIGDRTLDSLNAFSLIIVGLFLAAGAVGISSSLNAVRNIGELTPGERAERGGDS